MTSYRLPDLPYDYGDLEPQISGRIMELHHSKHHAAYVNGANTALEKLDAMRNSGDFATINMLQKNLAFNVSGHVLHSIFWNNLSSKPSQPGGELLSAIEKDFGDFEAFRDHLSSTTIAVQGSGWGVLAYEPFSERLVVEQVYDHQGNIANGSAPLLVIDAWEHAYYLQYTYDRAAFVKAMWDLINWRDVMRRYEEAKARAGIPV